SGRESLAGRFARVARGDQYQLGATPRRGRGVADLRYSARTRGPRLERQIPRPETEVVRAALYWRRQRDRHRASRGRPPTGIRGMALGASAKPPGFGRALQTQDLRARGRGI